MIRKPQNIIRLFILNVIIICFCTHICYCQDGNNYLQLTSAVKNFNLNSVSALETKQVQTNAFTFVIKSKKDNFDVYALITSYTSSNGYSLPEGILAVKLNTVSPSRSANFNEIPIMSGNQLIISTSKTNNSTVTYKFNLNLGPVGFDAPPGTYNATILFTMTQP